MIVIKWLGGGDIIATDGQNSATVQHDIFKSMYDNNIAACKALKGDVDFKMVKKNLTAPISFIFEEV